MNVKNVERDDKTSLDPRLIERLEEKKGLLDQYRPLPPSIVVRLGQDLKVLATYHSNAIEGNTLNLHETKLVIEEGLTIGGHNLREHLEATNHAEAFDLLNRLAAGSQSPTVAIVLSLHRLVMDKLADSAGKLRQNYVHITGALIEPPPPQRVRALLEEWEGWVNDGENSRNYHPIVKTAIAHHGFEALHPFEDGNGRTGRLLLNLMLLGEGYPPALLLKDWRGAYIAALRNGDRGNYAPLSNLVGRAVESSLDLYLEACNQFPGELLQPLSKLAEEGGYDVNYLGLLARKGHLEATKRRGRWYSTSAALVRYQTEAQAGLNRRGRPTSKSSKIID